MKKMQTLPGAFLSVSIVMAAALLVGGAFLFSTGDAIADESPSGKTAFSESSHPSNATPSPRSGMSKEEVQAMVAKIKGMTLRDLPSGIVFNYAPTPADINKWDPATAKFTFNEGSLVIQGKRDCMLVPYDKILYIILAPGNRLVFWLG